MRVSRSESGGRDMKPSLTQRSKLVSAGRLPTAPPRIFPMQDVRPAAVAGMFYPGTRHRLTEDVRGFLAGVSPDTGAPPKAVIVPHAGYIYSGPVAAAAYARLA